MPSYKSNISIITAELQNQLMALGVDMDELLNGIANDILASNIKRIHSERGGKDLDGESIGEYQSEVYRDLRDKKGKLNRTVNLEFTGRLRADLNVEKSGKDYLLGFTSEYGKQVSEANEERYGKEIWGVSDDDEKRIQDALRDYIKENLGE